MFDFAWSELALIGIVALIAIGPKDMPVAIKAVSAALKKARRMASELQGHVDEMVREADLHEVRDSLNELRSMNVRQRVADVVDPDGSIRRAVNEDPLHPRAPLPEMSVPARKEHVIEPPASKPLASEPPAFVPPASVPLGARAEPPAQAEPASPPPAFIPPDAARRQAEAGH
ncbi:MAG TPA: Sec-independent protein translocase protein TatB [Acetobacteraceae bacterium]|nr:Sec-independent protein translocase protein TatB [Acetobacteraceae bacterium]